MVSCLFGVSAKQRVVLKLELPPDVQPIGLTADAEGNLYTSAYGVGEVLKIDPK